MTNARKSKAIRAAGTKAAGAMGFAKMGLYPESAANPQTLRNHVKSPAAIIKHIKKASRSR